jgi:hypothetical protein
VSLRDVSKVRDRIDALLSELEDSLCSCDPAVGYACLEHALIRDLRNEIAKLK